MFNVARLTFRFPARPVPQFRCAVDGCPQYTRGHYCATHTATCDECGAEQERGTLLAARAFRGPLAGNAMWCAECVRGLCAGDAERAATRCYCGGSHDGVVR